MPQRTKKGGPVHFELCLAKTRFRFQWEFDVSIGGCFGRACRPEFRAILVRPTADSHCLKNGDLGNFKPTGGWSESFDLGLWTQWSHFICEVKTLASGCVLLTSRKTLGLYRDWTAREMGRDLRGLLGG